MATTGMGVAMRHELELGMFIAECLTVAIGNSYATQHATTWRGYRYVCTHARAPISAAMSSSRWAWVESLCDVDCDD